MRKRELILSVLLSILLLAGVSVAWANVTAVLSVAGNYGAPTGAYTGTATAFDRVKTTDQQFIQLADNTVITMQVDTITVDGSPSTSDMVLDTYDAPYPAGAKVEVSSNNVNWVQVYGKALNDCDFSRTLVFDDVCFDENGVKLTGISTACQAHLDLTATGLSSVSYVRLTDYTGAVDGDYGYPTLGFDLDAVYEAHQRFQNCLPVTIIIVEIDIKPGSDPNCFNINDHGVVPVAINGSAEFDVGAIDVATLNFAGLDVRVKGNGKAQCSIKDWNSDGFDDMVCQFVDDASSWSPGNSTATLTGNLYDGTPFEGTDAICIVPS